MKMLMSNILIFSVFMIFLLIGQGALLYGQGQKNDKYVKKIQETLKELGYNPGSADGLMGKRTRGAISAFQKNVGLPLTGKDSDRLRDYLYVYSLPVIRTKKVLRSSRGDCNYSFYFSDGNQSIEMAEDAAGTCLSIIRKSLAATLTTLPAYSLTTSKAGWRDWDGKLGNIF